MITVSPILLHFDSPVVHFDKLLVRTETCFNFHVLTIILVPA